MNSVELRAVNANTGTSDIEPVLSMSPEPVTPLSTQEDFPDGGWRAISVVIGSHLGLIVHFGVLNSVGAVQAYVSTHQLAGETVSSVLWVFSIYVSIPFLLGALVGPVFDSQGSTRLLLALTALLVTGFIAISFSNSIVAFIFSLSLCLGIAHALAIPPLVSLISHWFLCNRGKALGLASLGGSVGGTLWPLLLQALYTSVGFSWGIRIVGLICLVAQVALVVLVKLRFRRKLTPVELELEAKIRQLVYQTKFFFDLSAFRDWSFTFLVLGVFFTEIALMSILTYLATYAIAHGFSESRSLLLLTILNALGIPGRYIPGHFADRNGNFNVMVLMLTGFFLLIVAVWLPVGGTKGGLYAFAVLCGFFSSSILSLTPLCLGSITPVDTFGQRYGLMYTCSSTGILFGIPVGSVIIGDGSVELYRNFSIFCGVFSFLGVVCWFLSRYQVVGLNFRVKV